MYGWPGSNLTGFASERLKHPLFAVLWVTIILTPAFIIFWPGTSADAAIYFTFIKNFFVWPFTYQPHTVSFGATSPLHVILHAPLYLIFAEQWWHFSKLLNYSFIVLGLVLLNRSVTGNYKSLWLLTLLTLLSPIIFITAAQGYETPLAFLVICSLLFFLSQGYHRLILVSTGVLYLVRPEFLLIGLVLSFYFWHKKIYPPCLYLWVLLSFFPIIVYHSYMYYHTGHFMPSSVLVRATSSLTWWERLSHSGQSFTSSNALIYGLALLGLCVSILGEKPPVLLPLGLIFVPIFLLHLLFPPGEHTARYLFPLSAVLSVIIVQIVAQHLTWPVIFIMAIAIYGNLLLPWSMAARQSYRPLSAILQKPLADQLNGLTKPDDKILLTESQAQYYLDAFSYGLDGVVGNQFAPVMAGEETMADFIQKNDIRYIVVSDTFQSLPDSFAEMLISLYHLDQTTLLGDTIALNGLRLEKKLLNLTTDHTWNSVYQVLK